MTAGTIEYPHIQGHLLPMSTDAACLTRVGRVDSNRGPASFFRFAGEFPEKFRPRGISNALGQTRMVNHPVDVKVFHADHPKPINDLAALLMGKVVTSELDPLMHSCQDLAVLAPFRSAFRKLRMLPVHFGQGFLFLAEKAGVRYFFSIAEGGKGLESHINANLSSNRAKAFRLTLARKADIPLVGTATADSAGLDLPLDLAMVDHLDGANLGESYTVIMRDAKATLREGETVVAVMTLEAWVTWLFSMFSDTPEECLESQINPNGDILQDLGMHILQGKTFLFQHRKCINLSITTETFASLLIGNLAAFKQVIVQPTTLFKGFVELVKLFLGWIYPILKHFMHESILAQSRTCVNGFLRLRAACLLSPWLKPDTYTQIKTFKREEQEAAKEKKQWSSQNQKMWRNGQWKRSERWNAEMRDGQIA
jgi:hypothetical protein